MAAQWVGPLAKWSGHPTCAAADIWPRDPTEVMQLSSWAFDGAY